MANKGTINKVIIIGNLGANPELRTLPSGSSLTNLNVATTTSWVNKSTNEKNEETEWHRVSFFGRQAEVICQYAKKGSKLYVEGALRTRKWVDKEGITRYSTEITGQEFAFLGSSSGHNNSGGDGYHSNQSTAVDDEQHFSGMDDDIPF